MAKKSASDRTPEDMARLRAAMDIPDEPGEDDEFPWDGPEVQRDASGNILRRPLGQLRAAILASLGHHKMTRYELWRKARAYCDTLAASAVYEYLRGTREIKSEYMEALMKAAKLQVVTLGGSKVKKSTAVPRAEETLKRNAGLVGRLKKKTHRPIEITEMGQSGAIRDSEGVKSPYSKHPKGGNQPKGKPMPSKQVAASLLTQTAKKPVGSKGPQSPNAKPRKK
jgi:hypothetical protein